MKKLLLAGVAFASVFSGSALAADMPVKAVYKAPPPVYFSWTGCFIGGNGGGLWAKKDWYARDVLLGAPAVGAGYGSHDANSWVAGVQAGCDYQMGAIVIGIQGDYDWSNSKGSNNNLLAATLGDRSNIRSVASVTGRLGYTWDRAMLYVRGGVAWERDNYEIYTLTTGLNAFTASETRTGWTVGVGGEYAFINYLSGFIEYNYYDFGTRANTFAPVTAGGLTPGVDVKERKSVVRVGLNFRFGGGAVVAKY